jgi:hypothetical protein
MSFEGLSCRGVSELDRHTSPVPVAFDCECGRRWVSPPEIHCADCGPFSTATPDPVIWSLDAVPGTSIFLSGQMRDGDRFASLLGQGIERFVDVAGAAHFVWRPDAGAIARSGATYVEVSGVEDTNVDLPDSAFDRVLEALAPSRAAAQPTLLFCAAGLKRSPHLLYGVLRAWGEDAETAWRTVTAARPIVDPWQPYLDAAERWLAARSH